MHLMKSKAEQYLQQHLNGFALIIGKNFKVAITRTPKENITYASI